MNIKNIMLWLLLLVALNTNGWAQVLLENFDAATCGTNTCSCCVLNFIDNSCLSGWSTSHGTPNTISNGDAGHFTLNGIPTGNLNISGQAAMMFHGGCSGGEGLFTEFKFQQGKCYEIKLLLSTDTHFSSFDIFAADGLVDSPAFCCSNPQSATSELISSIPLSSINTGNFNSWATVNIIYTPTNDFGQFQFFPITNSGQVRVIVDNISVSEICPFRIDFNDPVTDIPANSYHASSFITTGTLGALGFIDADPNNSTELIAGTSITLSPNTFLDVNGSNTFLIDTKSCDRPSECPVLPLNPESGQGIVSIINPKGEWEINPNPVIASQYDNDDLEQRMAEEELKKETINNLEIYPNPNRGQFMLGIPIIADNKVPTEIMIYNQFGKLVYQKLVTVSTLDIDLNQIPSGVYIVNAKVNDQVFTERLIIQ